MKLYHVWCPGRDQAQADAYEVDAVDARAAAIKWAKEDDEASADYLIAKGAHVTVIVAEAAVPKRKVEFTIIGEYVRRYIALGDG